MAQNNGGQFYLVDEGFGFQKGQKIRYRDFQNDLIEAVVLGMDMKTHRIAIKVNGFVQLTLRPGSDY